MTPDSPEDAHVGGQAGLTPWAGEPMHGVYPAMDARFILVELGKLTTKVDRLIEDVGKINPKVDRLFGQVAFVKGAAWVIGGLILIFGPLIGFIASGKLSIAFH